MKRSAEAIWVEARNRWQINVQKDGKRKTFTSSLPGRKGKHEAELKADEWLESQTEDRRFGEAWDAYMADYRIRTARTTYKNRESIYHCWVEGRIPRNVKVANITPAMWQKCIDAANDENKSRNTMNCIRALISGFCHFCKRQRWAVDTPGDDDIIMPKVRKNRERDAMKIEDIKKVFEIDTIMRKNKAVPCFYIHGYRLMVLTGLRRGELAGLQWSDLEANNVLHVRRSINPFGDVGTGKTANAQRYVALCDRAQKVLADQREMLRKAGIVSPWIFPGKNANASRTNTIFANWKRFTAQNGIDATLHELRHTFISAMKSELPMALLKQQVGHSTNMDTLGTYGHEMAGDVDVTAEKIGVVFDTLIAK